MQAILDFVVAHQAVELSALFFLSEALALIPGVKANSVFQLCFGWISSKQAK